MESYVVLLRGINVSGKNKILMKELALMLEKLKFQNIRTYIQSGNVVLDSTKKETNALLENKIHKAIQETFALNIPVLVRTASEWESIYSKNPFKVGAEILANQSHVTLLNDLPIKENISALAKYNYPPDEYKLMDKTVYLLCAKGYSDCKYTNSFFEKQLKVSATTRNWKTVIKLHELLHS